MRLTEILSFMNSDRKETLELGELRKKFEVRKLQFEMRMKEAYLTMPFAGQVEFLFPYVEGERNFIQRGMEVALVATCRKFTDKPSWRIPVSGCWTKTGSSCRWKPHRGLSWASIRRVLKKMGQAESK